MRKRLKAIATKLSIVLCMAIPASANANNQDPINIAFTFSMPPYLSANLQSGIELDIITAALKSADIHNIKVQNVHYLRAIELSKLGQIDLIASNRNNELYVQQFPEILSSDKTIDYIDCAISLKERAFKLDKIENYFGKRIWAFKSASLSLGETFSEMAMSNPYYSEDFDQQKQLEMLVMGRIDIAVSDRNIFTYKLGSTSNYNENLFDYTTIGQPTERIVRSSNRGLINKINQGLSMIRDNGTFQEILIKYENQFFSSCD